jgi:hypothetical protein
MPKRRTDRGAIFTPFFCCICIHFFFFFFFFFFCGFCF